MYAYFIALAFGGIVGVFLRFGIHFVVGCMCGGLFPYGTLLINAVGGLFMGACAEGYALGMITETTRLFLMPGFLGAFTTFSAYSLETVSLFGAGRWVAGAGNILLNNAFALLFLAMGMWLVRFIKGLG